MTTFLINGTQIETLPPVFYHDYNDPKRHFIVNIEERPYLGDRVQLRDYDGDFQSECVVVKISTIRMTSPQPQEQVFVELEQIGEIEYLT